MSQREEWKFVRTYDFYTDLALRESSGSAISHSVESLEMGYIGLFHLGEAALTDAGYYKKEALPGVRAPSYNNDWSGVWLGKNGVRCKEDFITDEAVQHIAVRTYHRIIWERYLRDYQKFEGQDIGGITLTKSGMIAASHLVGASALKKFIDSKGTIAPSDALGTSCIEYLAGFGDAKYSVDYSTEELERIHFEAHNRYEDIIPESTTSVLSALEDLAMNGPPEDTTGKIEEEMQKVKSHLTGLAERGVAMDGEEWERKQREFEKRRDEMRTQEERAHLEWAEQLGRETEALMHTPGVLREMKWARDLAEQSRDAVLSTPISTDATWALQLAMGGREMVMGMLTSMHQSAPNADPNVPTGAPNMWDASGGFDISDLD